MGLFQDARSAATLLSNAVQGRLRRKELARKLAQQPEFTPGKFKVGVYFADGEVNLYQVRQWYKPLEVLAKTWPVVILSRNTLGALKMLDESPVPVAYVRTVIDLEEFIADQDLRVILYVNQNARNFQMFRYGQRWHVFINHGESDKMYMTTNQFKAYDYSLIAGDAARERLGRVLWDYDFDKRAIAIGRPQADHYTGAIPFDPDERQVILYAPTWEGDRPAAAYGSIQSHGLALIEALIATGRHRVIYRPHPRSGAVDFEYGQANDQIKSLLRRANSHDPQAKHIIDEGAELGWQLSVADMAVVDISAMVYDRLAAGKPLIITRPVNTAAEIDEGGYLSDCEWLDAEAAGNIVSQIDVIEHDPAAQERLARWCKHYFGDITPGVPTQRFHDAIAHLMNEWEKQAAIHAAD
ncbi:hypothetical protein [Aurantimicrobium sp. MWH-Uga1]|uniref:hypothetical protein n=1 Tax=Aurantimicrobium sp. MWH-Uga1 TaxID=2079575 RepID=UPI000DED3C52|nr:hypothetical protein [Aurantimicrobium sp. MWH-Uga1]AXE54793.1 hypothetical protein AURUGA1_01112 [Aurantimicrobium sp. MWH-Uga1]